MKSTFKKLFLLLFLSSMLASGANAQQYWGSAYFDANTGIGGGSSDYGTNYDANMSALDSCKKKHKNIRPYLCTYVTSFSNACFAIYWSPDNKAWGWGANDLYLDRAKNRAHSNCVEAGGKNCQNRLSFCTTRMTY